jgi:hypothetical protein
MNTFDNLIADVVSVKRLYLKAALPHYLTVN